jgi:hypothetical protein
METTDQYRKPRGDASLNRLTPEQQDEVMAQCESLTLLEGIAWLNTQFNIELSDRALSRWMTRKRKEATASTRLIDIKTARVHSRLIMKATESATEITAANVVLIAQAAQDELMKEAKERDETRLAKYMSVALRARDQEMRNIALSLAETRFRFDASKAALREAARLQEINQGPEDEQEKIEKVMLLLFGPEPAGFIVPPGKENA